MTDTHLADGTPAEADGKPAHYTRLDAAETTAWDMLEAAAASAKPAFHTPVLASVAPDGAPQARTVVLRGADRTARTLRFHTDARSPKADAIGADSRVEIVFYDADAKVQVRIAATAQVLTEGSAREAAWEASGSGSKVCYLAVAAPGTPHATPTSGLPPHADGGQRLDEKTLEEGRENFAVLHVAVERLDWLYLAAAGHRRARIDYAAGTRTWVVP